MSRSVLAVLFGLTALGLSSGAATAQTPSTAASTSEGAGKSAAQESQAAVPPLPTTLKGGMCFVSSLNARPSFETLELEITDQDRAGQFTGTFTRHSQYSGAGAALSFAFAKVPMKGGYDGKTLVLKVRASARHASCPDFNWEFSRGKDPYFERASADGSESSHGRPGPVVPVPRGICRRAKT